MIATHFSEPAPEEVADGMPYGPNLEFDAVDYTGVIPYLVRAVQEQNETIQSLQLENQTL